VAMGDILKNSPSDHEKYVIMYGGDLPVQTVKLIALAGGEKNKEIKYLWPQSIGSIDTDKPALILMMENNQDDLLKLLEKYPDGILKVENGIWIYKINITDF
jgi:hypothetical protein